MTRDEATRMLAQHQVRLLSREAREQLLLDWWTINADDPDYGSLPESLRDELRHSDQPGEVESSRYDPLLALGLRRSFVGVVNSYLERQLAKLGVHSVAIEGQPEPMVACPCCGYQSLSERGQYEICPVCFWEDNGSDDPDRLSGPNHMTLREAHENYRRLGAVSEQARAHVLRDGAERYSRGPDGSGG
jgi:Cysteine-rich CPCC